MWQQRLLLLALICFGPPLVAQTAEVERPNILWLTVEDLSPRLGCYGDDTVPTPNIDRLAEEGLRFTRAFTCTGVCAPCRHTIITGLYPMQSGAQYMRTGSKSSALKSIKDPELLREARERPLYEATPPVGVRCFPEYLRMAGYYCTNNSKQDYQFKAPVTVWDESSRKAHYKNRPAGQPFFAVFNKTVTHESGVFGNGRSPKVVDRDKVKVPSFLPDTPVVREDIARHYDNIIVLDKWVGQMLDELEDAGLADNTWVFFYTDHGDGLPRHKRWVYDTGTHVPLIIRRPDGGRAGSVDESMMSFIDLAPTALALAGLEPADYMPGRVIVGPDKQPAPDYVFMHRDRMDDTSHDTVRAVRDKQYRYVRNYRPQRPYLQPIAYRDRAATMGEIYKVLESGDVPPAMWQWAAKQKPLEELYDTLADPEEIHNLADDPQYSDIKQRLRSELEAWVERIDDPLALDEIEVLKTRIWPPDGQQPTTAMPQIHRASDGDSITIDCATAGATIGYRWKEDKTWSIYQGPIKKTGERLEVVAHRIGWKPSRTALDFGAE